MTSEDDHAVAELRSAVADAVARLDAGGVPDEALAEYVPPRRVLLVTRRDALRPIGRAWRLGVLLVTREGELYAAGQTTRAVPPGHPGHVSVSAEERRAYRAAAFRGPFEPGEVVNHSATRIDYDRDALRTSAGPVILTDEGFVVRWSRAPGTLPVPLRPYLAEHLELALHPPGGA